jgi:hypothetical protein
LAHRFRVGVAKVCGSSPSCTLALIVLVELDLTLAVPPLLYSTVLFISSVSRLFIFALS